MNITFETKPLLTPGLLHFIFADFASLRERVPSFQITQIAHIAQYAVGITLQTIHNLPGPIHQPDL